MNIVGITKITSTTASAAYTDGALVVSGGAGFAGKIYVNDTITGNAFNATSDYRIKTNVTDLNEEFTIDQVRPVEYNINDNTSKNLGIIAHELQEIYPFLVTGEKDGEQLQTVNYIGLIPVLINEIKLLKKTVKVLQNELEIIKNKI